MLKLIKHEAVDDKREFLNIIAQLTHDRTVSKMKLYRQHCNTSCFVHCFDVSYHCYKVCKMLGLDYVSAARGAMLHDMFLYDWRVKGSCSGLHAFTHGEAAYNNAKKIFQLNDIEKDVIVNHMWPLTIRFPKTMEGFVITFVDKYCALKEIIMYYMFKLIRVN